MVSASRNQGRWKSAGSKWIKKSGGPPHNTNSLRHCIQMLRATYLNMERWRAEGLR